MAERPLPSQVVQQEPMMAAEERGDYPLYYNTCYAIEMNNVYKVHEWDGQSVRMGLEEGGVFTEKDGCQFIDGRQTKLYIIK